MAWDKTVSLDRMVYAVEKVRTRVLKCAAAFAEGNVPYAIVGGNAVAAWVSTVDSSAVRNTRDVDVLLNRSDFERARAALESIGFIYRRAAGLDMFLEQEGGSARDAIHVVFAQERVRPHDPSPSPSVDEAEDAGQFRVVSLDGLVRMKLTAFRDRDRTHLRDLIDVGLVDASWLPRLGPRLAERLQQLFNDPEG
jgi:hypothetical protein